MNETMLKKLESDSLQRIEHAKTLQELEALDVELFGRKQGTLTEMLKTIKDLSLEEKKSFGMQINTLKATLQQAFDVKKTELLSVQSDLTPFDITEPYIHNHEKGTLHPITLLQQELEDFFVQLGFLVLDGPEIESEYYNFESLNIPADHPARDMQDTFYIENHPGMLMRTHTSSVQVRALREYGAPLQAIVPGRCFRNEATDARHEHTFYQLEGFVVGEGIRFSHLKGILEAMAQWLYGSATKVRLRPKFYRFVEPGVNGEVT